MTNYTIYLPDAIDQVALDLLKAEAAFTINAPGKIAREEALRGVTTAHAMIIRSGIKVDAEMLEAAPVLKAIARAGVGVDNVDLEVATQRGVIVMNTPDGNTVATAEHTFGLMLALARHIPAAHTSLAEGQWERKLYQGAELRAKTLGIIGFGRIGQALAKRAQAFEMQVIAHDPYIPSDVAAAQGVEMVDLETLYARADYISLHSLITDETRGMINTASIARMKAGVRIVNAARGPLIVAEDLAAAIQSGQVAGAALDVYVNEPPEAGHPLIGLAGVVHTPHLGASTAEAQVKVAVDAAEQIRDGLLTGGWRNVVNPKVLGK